MSDREKIREADELPAPDQDETVRVERVADPEAEERSDPAENAQDDAEVEPVRSRSRRAPRAGTRRGGHLLHAALVLALLAGTLLIPQVRTVLRQSFTHLPQTATALAFTASPTISGTTLSVPITVTGTNTGTDTYHVKVWTVNAAGKTDGGTTAQVPQVKGVNATVVKLPIAVDAAVVWVSLDGTDHLIHFKISVG
ncbi:MAG TPA: hypothetical protein VFN97_24495 [Actinospica sp.]|nr:hypothetical protein [Actinospica sp.]